MVYIIDIEKRYKSLCLWRNNSREWEIAKNVTEDEPHVGIRTGVKFNTRRDAIQWVLYNYGATRQVWVEKSDHFKRLN